PEGTVGDRNGTGGNARAAHRTPRAPRSRASTFTNGVGLREADRRARRSEAGTENCQSRSHPTAPGSSNLAAEALAQRATGQDGAGTLENRTIQRTPRRRRIPSR